MATRERLEEALKKAHAAGDTAAARRFAQAIRDGEFSDDSGAAKGWGQEAPPEDPSALQGFTGGFGRGVRQTLGGAAQRAAEARKKQVDSRIERIIEGMESGDIPMDQDNMQKLETLQDEAVKLAQTLASAESREMTDRQNFGKLQEDAPASAFVGNVAGQMAALPVPGAQGRLPVQMIRGGLEGATVGAIQPTVGDESPMDAAKTGSLVGSVAPAALRPITSAAGAGYRALTGRASGDAAEAARFADENQLPLMTSDVSPPETFTGRAAQSLGEKVPFTGTGGPRAAQLQARQQQIRQLSEEYGIPNEEEIYQSLIRQTGAMKRQAGETYNRVVEQMADTPIPLNRTVAEIDKQIANYSRPGAASNPQVVRSLQNFKDQVTSGDNDLSLLRQNRTLFRELIKGTDMTMSDSAQRANDAVYRAITQDMVDGVESKLGAEAARQMRGADAIWASEANLVKKTKLRNLLSRGDVKPEEATKMLFSTDRSEVGALYRSLDESGRQNARAAIIARAVESSKESPERFLNQMDRMKIQKNTFFRGEERKQIDGLINYLEHTRRSGSSGVLTQTGMQNMVFGIPAGVMADFQLTGGMGTAGFATTGALARAYESKPVRNVMMRMASVKKGSTEFEVLASAFERQMQKALIRAQEADQEE